MTYCMNCGKPLERAWLIEEGRERDICAACRTVHYENPKVLIACIVYCGQRVVLSQRANEPEKGAWFVPTGYVECGEAAEEAAARELKEEVGLEIPASRMFLYSVASLPDINQIYIAFRVELNSEPKFAPGPESLAVRFFNENEIRPLPLAFDEFAQPFFRNLFRRLDNNEFRALSFVLRRPR